MKKFWLLIIAIFSVLTTYAQVENSIILDKNSFRAVQRDALTGVNIDKIGEDTSRKPCARVKIKFANMSRAEVDALDIKFQSNTDLIKRKVADYYDNVLILEMTAKPNTRFYVKSPEFGESNEVTLNLEAYKEYELEAHLNQAYSIIIDSNVEGAEVYIDGVMKGRTGANFRLTIKDVVVGKHTLKVVYSGIAHEQKIVVNSGNISFRQNVNTAASEPQFVVFVVNPSSAVVIIDNQHYTLQNGAMQVVLDSGTYNYTVTAAGYHSQSGTFTVSGNKVERYINLTADSATVTLTAPDNAEIWVNGIKKGVGTWSGTLNSGTYIFEARKAGYQSAKLSQRITSATASQSYTLPAPTPIVGSLIVSGVPITADVALDGKHIGTLPVKLNNILAGSHTLKITKLGYRDYTKTITVEEGQTTTINATLAELNTTNNSTSQQMAQSSSQQCSALTFGPYKVGDYYNDGVLQGVVYEVDATGRKGMLVSLDEAPETTYSKLQDWCNRKGAGWKMPYINELKKFAVRGPVLDVVNATLRQYGVAITDKAYESLSTEYKSINHIGDSDSYRVFHYFVSGNGVSTDVHRRGQGYESKRSARAVCSFTAKYRVGEYYNENGKQGVIFEVSEDGKHGKILSMTQNYLRWAEQDSPESKRTIKANSTTDGAYNTDRVHSRPGWQKKYPAFKWCAELGEGWYIPAIEELKAFLLNDAVHDAVNRTLAAQGAPLLKGKIDAHTNTSSYLSSTESSYMFDGWCSYYGAHWKGTEPKRGILKYIDRNVRAVAKF